jgi:hypothetical protein
VHDTALHRPTPPLDHCDPEAKNSYPRLRKIYPCNLSCDAIPPAKHTHDPVCMSMSFLLAHLNSRQSLLEPVHPHISDQPQHRLMVFRNQELGKQKSFCRVSSQCVSTVLWRLWAGCCVISSIHGWTKNEDHSEPQFSQKRPHATATVTETSRNLGPRRYIYVNLRMVLRQRGSTRKEYTKNELQKRVGRQSIASEFWILTILLQAWSCIDPIAWCPLTLPLVKLVRGFVHR